MSTGKLSKIGRFGILLNSHRWVLIISLGFILGITNLVEIQDDLATLTVFHFLIDIITGFLVPLVMVILFMWLDRAQKDQQATEKQLILQKTLAYQISKTNSWNELVEVVIQFPRTIIPYLGALLWLYDTENNQYLLEAGWGFTGTKPPNPPCVKSDAAGTPSNPGESNSAITAFLSESTDDPVDLRQEGLRALSISFSHLEQPVGILYIYIPHDYDITQLQESSIANISPAISQAMFEHRMNDLTLLQANAIKEERSRIAKNLHDTVAQELFYLRLQLDQFTNYNYRDLAKLMTVQEDLVKLRDIADGAYTEIRATLDALEDEHNKNLTSTMSHYADFVAKRTGLEVTFLRKGTQQNIPITLANLILKIFRELLANVEFHASALHVNIEVTWSPDQLSLSISDDGLGFDTEKIPVEGHYGLEIIRERANQINAEFEIDSTPGKGTQVKLVIPLRLKNELIRTESFHWLTSVGESK